jgi:hypothetical protein
MARTLATVMVALTVVLSMAAAPAAAVTQDDGLLGGDDSDDGLVEGETTVGGDQGVSVGEDGVGVGGDEGVEVGTDGVSVGGDSGINASTDGVTVADQEVGGDSLPDGETPSLPGDDSGGDGTPSLPGGDSAPVDTDGSNVEVGGDQGVSVGTDGVSVAGDEGVSVGPEGVNVGGQEISRESLPGGEGVPGGDSLPGGDAAPSLPGGSQNGEVPTGPVPVTIDYSVSSADGEFNPILTAETQEGPQGSQADLMLAGVGSSERARLVPRADISDNSRTYLDLDGDGTVSRSGVEDAEAAIYTVNESGGEYLLVLNEDMAGARSTYYAQDEAVGFTNANTEPGTKKGNLGGGLFASNLLSLGPSAPVGPDAPRVVGGGVECDGEECRSGTFGVNESIPNNQATEPIKANYPFPRSTDTSGIGGVPCSKPVTPSDLPLERAPGVSDLPSGTLPGVPTSLLTNDAVFGLAFSVAPDPCDATDPVAEPAANPAVEPGEYEGSPTFDVDNGGMSTDNGFSGVRAIEIGPGNGAGTADGVYALVLNQNRQTAVHELEVSDSEYDYLLLNARGTQEDGTASGTSDIAVRDDMSPSYAGVSPEFSNELGTTNGDASITVEVVGRSVGGSLSCDASGCQPGYDGLPKLSELPTIPNPLGGSSPIPGPGSLPN